MPKKYANKVGWYKNDCGHLWPRILAVECFGFTRKKEIIDGEYTKFYPQILSHYKYSSVKKMQARDGTLYIHHQFYIIPTLFAYLLACQLYSNGDNWSNWTFESWISEGISLRPKAVWFWEQKMKVNHKSFQATMTDCLWQFMWNTCQPWNEDVMAFLCTGRVEVVTTRWHLCC